VTPFVPSTIALPPQFTPTLAVLVPHTTAPLPDVMTPAATASLPHVTTPTAPDSPADLTTLTATSAPPTSPSAGPPLPNQPIAYCSKRDGNTDLHLIFTDGSGSAQLTTDPGDECHHAWSPDGSLLAFIYERSRKYEIYVLDPDTLGEMRISTVTEPSGKYSWSPDSSRLAVSYESAGRQAEVWTIRNDGSGLSRLTNATDVQAYQAHFDPAWSPDGSLIAYVAYSGPSEKSRIHLVTPGGEDRTPLEHASRDHAPLSWSPDGASLLFSDGNDLYLASVRTLEEVQLTDNPAVDWTPAWSPEGQAIAFIRMRLTSVRGFAAGELLVTSVDGSSERSLTSQHPHTYAVVAAAAPSWSANGQWIAFTCLDVAEQRVLPQVCLVTSDGMHLVRLTSGESNSSPQFQPQ